MARRRYAPKQEFVTEQACNDITFLLKARNYCEIILLDEATGNPKAQTAGLLGEAVRIGSKKRSVRKNKGIIIIPKEEGGISGSLDFVFS